MDREFKEAVRILMFLLTIWVGVKILASISIAVQGMQPESGVRHYVVR